MRILLELVRPTISSGSDALPQQCYGRDLEAQPGLEPGYEAFAAPPRNHSATGPCGKLARYCLVRKSNAKIS